jgi:tRNA(Ile)-lysidine synthetase-like protein
MEIKVPKGKYVLAVSGGVDSIVLLDLLSNLPGVELIAAHFNHGIRPESDTDEAFVARVAVGYSVNFESGRATLGPGASEEAARQARYRFLEAVQEKHSAGKIITAHHQDDLIETALINLIRGTGRQGLSAISSNPKVLRPLLDTPKSEIIKYAKARKLNWREDATNQSADYLRNRLRHNVLAAMSGSQRKEIVARLARISSLNLKIDENIAILSQIIGNGKIDRLMFTALPASVGSEILVYQLKARDIRDFDAKTISRLNMAVRTAKAGTTHPIKRRAKLEVGPETAELLTS